MITVAPVVVIPLIDSKKASLKFKLDEPNIKGIHENNAIKIQEKIVKTYA